VFPADVVAVRKDFVMTLAPLLQSSAAIQIHAFAAMAAFALGVVQLSAPKGTIPHRIVGWLWVALMTVIAVTAFFIQELRIWGPWSPIHLLAIFTLITLPMGVWYARHHRVAGHRWVMSSIFLGALVIAGAFTFFPGRIMYRALMGS
jgi:uncharacterized membrane protein